MLAFRQAVDDSQAFSVLSNATPDFSYQVTLKNTGPDIVFVGDEGVADNSGIPLSPNEILQLEVAHEAVFLRCASSESTTVTILVLKR